MPILSVYVTEDAFQRLTRIAEVDSMGRSVEDLASDCVEDAAIRDPDGRSSTEVPTSVETPA